MIHVKSGVNVPGIQGDLDQAIPELQLANLTLGEQARIVEGVLYFAVVGNHIGLVEGQRTRARTLERYLTRLLQDSGEMELGEMIILNARLEGSVQEVKELTISPRRSKEVEDQPVVIETEAGAAKVRNATVLDVLETLGWSADDIENLESSMPADGWLEGFFKVVFKKKGRKNSPVDRAVLETALRNLDPKSIGMLGIDGAREKNKLVKLSKKETVPLAGDLLDPEKTMEAIVKSLKSWSSNGRIDCDFNS